MRIIILLMLCSAAIVVNAFRDRRIFVSHFADRTKTTAPDLRAIRNDIRERTLTNLRALPGATKADLVRLADEIVKQPYPVKTAWDYLEVARTGNRIHYEDKLDQHRRRLALLTVGHLLNRETNATGVKYIDEIINGVWMILEESTWCWPAHITWLQGTNDHLPAPGHLAIDLGAGEVAKFLAWIKLLVGDQMDHVSKAVNERIDYELRNRIFDGFLRHNYFWDAFEGADHTTGNWNIWINGNILKSAIMTLDDGQLFNRVLNRTVYSADYFLDSYGDDGGCDEGPMYWREAGGRLIEYLESLEQLFPDSVAYLRTIRLIQAIGEYTYKMVIDGSWVVNFADATGKVIFPPSLIAKYGRLFDDERMKHFSAYVMQSLNRTTYLTGLIGNINEFCNQINMQQEIDSFRAELPVDELVWFPDIQVISSRSKPTETVSKLFIATKAGTNRELYRVSY